MSNRTPFKRTPMSFGYADVVDATPTIAAGVPIVNVTYGPGSYRIGTRFVVGELLTRDTGLTSELTSAIGPGSSVAFGGFPTRLGLELRGLVGSRAAVVGTPSIAVVLPDPDPRQRTIVMSATITVASEQSITIDDINRAISRAVANSISLGLRPSATMPADGRPLYNILMRNGDPVTSPVYVSGSTEVVAVPTPPPDGGPGDSTSSSGLAMGLLVAGGVGVGLAIYYRDDIARWLRRRR